MMLSVVLFGAVFGTAQQGAFFAGNSAEEFATMNNIHVGPVIIADHVAVDADSMRPHESISTLSESGSHVFESVFFKPDASYIKVHFKSFNIPQGAYVSVQNPDGTEEYTFDNTDREWATYDPEESGTDGRRSFYSMSVDGDTAIVRLHVLDAVQEWNDDVHVLDVDTFDAGFALDALESKQDDVNTLSTCGKMERYDRECWRNSRPVEYERARPLARLVMNHGGLCTGWRVGSQNRVMTNEHCIDSARAVRTTEVQFNYEKSSCNGRNMKASSKVRGDKFLIAEKALDYCLFTVSNFNSIRKFGHFGLDPRECIRGEEIYIPQHGAGSPKQISINSDRNDDDLCRIDQANRWDTDFGYNCDTIGGSSGSPVLAKSSHKVVALHHLGGCPNSGAKILKVWPKIARFFQYKIPEGDRGAPQPSPTPWPRPTPAPRPRPSSFLKVLSGPCQATYNCFTSSNYPNPYGSQEKCVVEITKRGKLKAVDFDTEATWDQLVVQKRVYTGTRGPVNVQVKGGDKIYWRSDFSNERSGFKLCVDAQSSLLRATNGAESVFGGNVGDEKPGDIETRNR